MAYEDLQSAKKKVEKEIEALNERIDELTNENNKLNRSKKKTQEEVCQIEGRLMYSLSSAIRVLPSYIHTAPP